MIMNNSCRQDLTWKKYVSGTEVPLVVGGIDFMDFLRESQIRPRVTWFKKKNIVRISDMQNETQDIVSRIGVHAQYAEMVAY